MNEIIFFKSKQTAATHLDFSKILELPLSNENYHVVMSHLMTTELNADDFELVINPMSPTFKNKLLMITYISNLAVGKKLQF